MIITRSPLRISVAGGGTDLPSYYTQHCGLVIAAAIDKYVYISLHPMFEQQIFIRYSRLERVQSIEEIQHPIVREALGLMKISQPYLQITSIADIPAGTGLGSSGSFTTALLKALHALKKNLVHPQELAEQACHIEIDLLKEPVGKQDQYIAAHGGVTVLDIARDGVVTTRALRASADTLDLLEDSLLMVSTKLHRVAGQVLKEQDDRTRADDAAMIDNLHRVKELGQRSLEAIESGNLGDLGRLMNEHWQYKKRRSPMMSNADIDRWYAMA